MSEKAQGFEEYTPSRLEWIVVMLNSHIHYINAILGDDFNAVYATQGSGNTIALMIRHYSGVSSEHLKNVEDMYKKFAMDMAKKYNWDSWLEIQTRFEPIDRPPKE